MSETKIVVPQGMLNAAEIAYSRWSSPGPEVREALEAALRWLSENPIVPTIEDVCEFGSPEMRGMPYLEQWKEAAIRWQRRMFLAPVEEHCPTCGMRTDNRIGVAPEPEVPENDICEIGAVLRDRKIRISNAEVGEILKTARSRQSK